MKVAVVIGDGMGDYPQPKLGNRTPLQAAAIPNMRRIAGAGRVFLVKTVPDGMAPGSDVANLSLMGFDPRRYYTGRAPIEAAGAGLAMGDRDVAFRCNLVTIADGLIQDHSAGHISTDEARPLVETLNRHLGRDGLRFHVSTGYRHLVLWQDGPCALETTPPHDVLGQPMATHLPRGEGRDEVIRLMQESVKLFADHPVNAARRQAGKRIATQIWLWGQGRGAALPSYGQTYGLSGAVISAVDLVRGIGRLSGLDVVRVPGATGFLDTNYAGKVAAALEALQRLDFVFVHVEAPDECSHAGDLELKLRAIETFDCRVVGPIHRGLESLGLPYKLIIGTDHCTPVSTRNHTSDPVPIALLEGPMRGEAREAPFDETVNGGRPSGMAFEWMRETLQSAKGTRPGNPATRALRKWPLARRVTTLTLRKRRGKAGDVET